MWDHQSVRFFVSYVRYGGVNPWSFDTRDIYYILAKRLSEQEGIDCI